MNAPFFRKPALYNEIDAFAGRWLHELCAAGAILDGDIDGRSVTALTSADLAARDQIHFFAGIGIWSYALECAGWPSAGLTTWTASLPCQPFSSAGRKRGFDDERHLWPSFYNLVRECGPDVIFGEQVASKDGYAWLDNVHVDLEAAGYAVGAVDFCAAGVGAPQRRQRLYWVATRMGNAEGIKRKLQLRGRQEGMRWEVSPGVGSSSDTAGATAGFWGDAVWFDCLDGTRRPLGPGIRSLASGSSWHVDALRGFGNALNAEAAVAFVGSTIEVILESA